MATLKEPFALDRSLNTTEVTPRNIADVLAEGLSHITGRTASEVEYDNTDSGLTSDDVQGAIDELSERPTLPSVDIQTAVDEFETYNGGLLSSCKVALSPNQDLHGYENPWVGGAGKNKINCDAPTITKNGVTVTNNGDGTFTATGTITAQTDFYLTNSGSTDLIPLGDITDGYLVTGCPNSGGTSSYQLIIGSLNSRYATDSGNGDTLTNVLQVGIRVILRVFSNYSFPTGGLTFKPMIRASGTSADFAPYSNICPISGHTQVEVDVSDGQTTQEQVTVNLGGTYYSGTLDVVSGVFTPDKGIVDDASTLTWIKNGSYNNIFYAYPSPSNLKIGTAGRIQTICSDYKSVASNDFSTLDQYYDHCIAVQKNASTLVIVDSTYSTASDLTSALSGVQIVYEIATPTSIQLSPTMVKALVGENHLSAPLEGQEITESKYRELFTWDEVEAYVNAHSGGGSGMNYSTEEQVVGTWIDGKPLYQKTFVQQLSGTTGSIDLSSLNISEAFIYGGFYDIGVTNLELNEWLTQNDKTYAHVNKGFTPPVIDMQCTFADAKATITLQYTKTTD